MTTSVPWADGSRRRWAAWATCGSSSCRPTPTRRIVTESSSVDVLVDGYQLVEGPRVDGDGNVWFTEVLGGGVPRGSPTTNTVETVVPKRRGVGGLALHAAGGVVVSGRDITHVQPDGTNR